MTDDHQKQDEADRPPQETVSFTFDRMTVARFRETFPNARWSDRLQAWTVPRDSDPKSKLEPGATTTGPGA